jgi:hypothetical protein
VRLGARGRDDGKSERRQRIGVELARQATATPEARVILTKAPWDYTKVARERGNRTIKNLAQYLPKLANGPAFQCVTRYDTASFDYGMTENKGLPELFPEPEWIEELWHEDIRVSAETYRLYREIGQTRDRLIRELLYWREDRADEERMREAARQAVREREQLQKQRDEEREEGLRRSERGHIGRKRRYDDL